MELLVTLALLALLAPPLLNLVLMGGRSSAQPTDKRWRLIWPRKPWNGSAVSAIAALRTILRQK